MVVATAMSGVENGAGNVGASDAAPSLSGVAIDGARWWLLAERFAVSAKSPATRAAGEWPSWVTFESATSEGVRTMNNIIYIIGLVVVVIAVLWFFGLRWTLECW
jgi:hypothetical protein